MERGRGTETVILSGGIGAEGKNQAGVCVRVRERKQEIASARVPAGGLQMWRRTREGKPGREKTKEWRKLEKPLGWEAEPICMQQEQEPSEAGFSEESRFPGHWRDHGDVCVCQSLRIPPLHTSAATVQVEKLRLGSHMASN